MNLQNKKSVYWGSRHRIALYYQAYTVQISILNYVILKKKIILFNIISVFFFLSNRYNIIALFYISFDLYIFIALI